jgi:hypothetical protein
MSDVRRAEVHAGDPCPLGCTVGWPGRRVPELLRVNVDGEVSCPTCWECFGIDAEAAVAAQLTEEN